MNFKIERLTQGIFYLIVIQLALYVITVDNAPIIPHNILKWTIIVSIVLLVVSVLLFLFQRKRRV